MAEPPSAEPGWMEAACASWIAKNPGSDAVDVARHFRIDLRLAVNIIGTLTEKGTLRDADA